MPDVREEMIGIEPQAIKDAGLIYVSDVDPGIYRRKAGKGFSYRDRHGHRITDPRVIARIRKLAIPPAYTDVWICPDPNGHIQATGRDAKGRKQYRYHQRFREIRDATKYDHLFDFADALPLVRQRVDSDMRKRGLPYEKVIATIVHLLDTTLIRIGNKDYAKQNKSYGLTTLRSRHVSVEGNGLRFQFKGKSGKEWKVRIHDRRVAKVIKAIQELPGQRLFQYLGEDGERHEVTSGDVNAYLKEISGQDISAKDFRTWAGTVLAAMALSELEPFDGQSLAKRNVRTAIARVASTLGNTPTICRTCYVHPAIVDSYLCESLAFDIPGENDPALADKLDGLRPEEAAVVTFLRRRLSPETAIRRSAERGARLQGHAHSPRQTCAPRSRTCPPIFP